MNIPDILLPIINVKTNSLDAILLGLGLRFTHLSKTSPDFQELICNRSFTIQIASKEGVARHYVINHGEFNQYYGYATEASLTMTFINNATGVKVLTAGEPTAFMSAIQDQELTMDGDFSLLMWFGEAAKLVTPDIPEQVKTVYETVEPYAKMAVPVVQSTVSKLQKKFK